MSSPLHPLCHLIALFSLGSLVWSFALFPKIMGLLGKVLRKSIPQDYSFEPFVTLFIPAFNEEKVIAKKIKNVLRLHYPKDKLEIMICSDASNDSTNEIVTSFSKTESQISFFDFKNRSGKTGMINKAIPHAKGEIIVFTDSNTMFNVDTITNLVHSFYHESVGAVLGQVQLFAPDNSVGLDKEVLYRSYETEVKYVEGLWGASMGAFGGLYAIRKKLFTPLPQNAYSNDDFLIPSHILATGYRVHLEKRAISQEETGVSITEEFTRRVRIGAGNFQSFTFMPKLLNPLQPVRLFFYYSHKVTRWFSPFFLLAFLITTSILAFESVVYKALFYGQLLFYVVAVVGWLGSFVKMKIPIAHSIFHFTAMNIALFIGFFRFAKGIKTATWTSIDRSIQQ